MYVPKVLRLKSAIRQSSLSIWCRILQYLLEQRFERVGVLQASIIIIWMFRVRSLWKSPWLLSLMIFHGEFPIMSLMYESFRYGSSLCLNGFESCSPPADFSISQGLDPESFIHFATRPSDKKEEPTQPTNRDWSIQILRSYNTRWVSLCRFLRLESAENEWLTNRFLPYLYFSKYVPTYCENIIPIVVNSSLLMRRWNGCAHGKLDLSSSRP